MYDNPTDVLMLCKHCKSELDQHITTETQAIENCAFNKDHNEIDPAYRSCETVKIFNEAVRNNEFEKHGCRLYDGTYASFAPTYEITSLFPNLDLTKGAKRFLVFIEDGFDNILMTDIVDERFDSTRFNYYHNEIITKELAEQIACKLEADGLVPHKTPRNWDGVSNKLAAIMERCFKNT